MKKNVRDLAESVRLALEIEGVHTHWSDTHTTGSIYLDLDHGLLSSVRVSDHKSKGNGFKFEIGPHIDSRHIVDKAIEGEVYSVEKFSDSEIDLLIEAILILRMRIMSKVGVEIYRDQVRIEGKNCDSHVPATRRRRKSRARVGD